MTRRAAQLHRATAAAIVIATAVVLYVVIGFTTLDAASRRVPLLVGGVTLALLIVEILRQYAAATTGVSTDRDTVMQHARKAAPLMRELRVLGSVVGIVAGIYLVGFLIAIPVYLLGAMVYVGSVRARTALLVTVMTSAAIYVAFDLLLAYRLFPGILFS